MDEYKLVAPDFDRLLLFFDRGYKNPSVPSDTLKVAMEQVFDALRDLAPLKKNKEVKSIWLTISRGTIEDYGSYEELLECGEVDSQEEYENRWKEDYPDPVSWYELTVAEILNKEEEPSYRAISVGNKMIVSASMNEGEPGNEPLGYEEAAIAFCRLLVKAIEESMKKLSDGTYNEFVEQNLPYWHRTGVIKRSIVWQKDSEWKENELDGLSDETIKAFISLIQSGANEEDKIGRIKSFTANDFFRACSIGHRACGKDIESLSLEEQYFANADGRDEGLSGKGHGLNAGPGIDYDDPEAWNKWYFDRNRGGGHPWEVMRGGNSTHVDLFVRHDKNDLDYFFRTGKITEDEYRRKSEKAGFFFEVAGKYRVFEAVNFYISLIEAGLPVVIRDSREILNILEGNGYIGIVPHDVVPRYCEDMFPEKYGKVIDFIHIYEEEKNSFGDMIEWLPETEAELSRSNI